MTVKDRIIDILFKEYNFRDCIDKVSFLESIYKIEDKELGGKIRELDDSHTILIDKGYKQFRPIFWFEKIPYLVLEKNNKQYLERIEKVNGTCMENILDFYTKKYPKTSFFNIKKYINEDFLSKADGLKLTEEIQLSTKKNVDGVSTQEYLLGMKVTNKGNSGERQ